MPFNMTIRWLTHPDSAMTRTVWLISCDPASRHTQAMRVLRARRRWRGRTGGSESDPGNAPAWPHRPAGMDGYAVDGPIGRATEVGPRATVVPCPVQSFRPRHHDVAGHAGDHGGTIDGAAERRTVHERPRFAAIAGHRRHAVATVVS